MIRHFFSFAGPDTPELWRGGLLRKFANLAFLS